MQSGTRRTSGFPAETGSDVGGGAVCVTAVGGGHAEAIGVFGACCGRGGDSVVFQTATFFPEASWWSA